MKRPRVLLDVDGVLAQFASAAYDVIERVTGTRPTTHAQWDIFDNVATRHHDACFSAIGAPGFCASIAPYSEAVAGVRALRAIADVRFVTSPWPSPTWRAERTAWLVEHMGAAPDDVEFNHSKHEYPGDVFVDDKVAHVAEWRAANVGHALLWSQPYNRDAALEGVTVVDSWAHVEAIVRGIGRAT